MKRHYFLFCLFALCSSLNAQVVISEIMYNPPESNTDSLEYIELYNTTMNDIDISGWSMTQGVDHVFVNTILPSNEPMVIAVNARAFETVFGIIAIEWDAGALKNDGETIELSDASGNIISSVTYADSGEWPGATAGTDGNGASIELCDLTSDESSPFNWNVSMNDTGIELNGNNIFGTPNDTNQTECRDDVAPMYTAEEIINARATDGDGVALNNGQLLELKGNVHGVNLNGAGLQFALIDDNNNGIGVYSGSESFGYTVNEGDEVTIQGSIGQFNGLTQINADSLWVSSTSSNIVDPRVVTVLDESTESSVVKLENLSLVDPTEWLGDGSSFNVNVTDGTNTYAIRIHSNTDISSLGAPEGLMSITGIGGQFDPDAPFLEGYQLLPRYEGDIIADNFTPGGGGDEYMEVNITDINGEEADGSASSDGMKVKVTAITHGINFRPAGLQFTIIDANNNGIGVFSGSENYGYAFDAGDEIEAWGTVSQFNGLTQISLDSIALVSFANDLVNPRMITSMDESTESSYLSFTALEFVDPSEWLGDGSSFNIDMVDGSGNVIAMRIDSDSPLANMATAPDGASIVTGIGGQFDPEAPYDEGYQFFPISFMPYLGIDNFLEEDAFSIVPNPATDLITIKSEFQAEKITILSLQGQEILKTNDSSIDVSSLAPGVYFALIKYDQSYSREVFIKM